jgi:predicted Fe-Mo cluster-binding NifX family protein
MLACIPTRGNAGIDDHVNEHFGSAPFFTLYDTGSGEVTIIENRNAHHSHGTCHPMNQLANHHIDCVVCTGMGRRAIEALNSEGVKVYQVGTVRVGDVIESIKAQQLVEIDPATACHGMGQRGGCAHGPSHGGHGHGGGAGFGHGHSGGQ